MVRPVPPCPGATRSSIRRILSGACCLGATPCWRCVRRPKPPAGIGQAGWAKRRPASRPGTTANPWLLPDALGASPPWTRATSCGILKSMALVCWGLGFYGHGFYLAELRRQHGWSTALISSASTACYLLSAVLVIFISDAIRRFGVRTCVLSGALAFAASAAALPLISEPWHLFGLYLLMALG